MRPLLLPMLGFILGASVTRAAAPAQIVMMIGEDEYQTWVTLPEFAHRELEPRGYRVTVIAASPQTPNDFPGLVPALRRADLLLLSVRRRTPQKEELAAVREYLAGGKPLLGIRTACHAFALRFGAKPAQPNWAAWQDFDPEVLGGNYTHDSHRKDKAVIRLAPGAADNPILIGVNISELVGNGSLYHVSPLKPDTVPLLIGTIPEEMAEPVAWTRRYGERRNKIFYTSLGALDDFRNPQFRRLLLNAVDWTLR